MKICLQCRKEFIAIVIKNGKRKILYTRKYCLDCLPFNSGKFLKKEYTLKTQEQKHKMVEKITQYRKKRKQKIIEYKGGCCQICKKITFAYDLHHLDPNLKDFSISQKSWSFENFKPELDKCILVCRNCHHEIHEKFHQRRSSEKSLRVIHWRRRTKIKIVEYKGGCCQICGYKTCLKALELHHIDPNQKEFVISGITKSWNKIKTEIEKCILVCSNCHQEIHHGTLKIPDLPIHCSDLLEPSLRVEQKNLCIDCSKSIHSKAKRCTLCNGFVHRKIKWPSTEELENKLQIMSMVALSKELGVSDNAIKNHLTSERPTLK
jgi:ribosomal protein L30E